METTGTTEIKITTQAELDSVALDFAGTILISGGTRSNPLVLSKKYENAAVILVDKAFINMRGNSTVNYMRENSTVNDMRENSTVNYMRGNSTVNYMRGNSTVNYMRGNSTVNYMRENSTVNYMRGNSTVNDMRENSTVNDMWGNSTVNDMWENSTVNYMRGNSTVNYMRGFASVLMARGSNKITCHGQNLVRVFKSNQGNLLLNLSEDSNLIVLKDPEPTIKYFLGQYPIKMYDEQTAIMYKAVRKGDDGIYKSDYTSSFKYEIGKEYAHECDPNVNQDCSYGIHVAEKRWALKFGHDWDDMALLECHVPIDSVVVPISTDGKVRTSKCTIIREVPKEEYNGK